MSTLQQVRCAASAAVLSLLATREMQDDLEAFAAGGLSPERQAEVLSLLDFFGHLDEMDGEGDVHPAVAGHLAAQHH